MEDISRELEREIARAKPAEHKRSKKKRILIVDDFGGMKSGGYLRVLVKLLLVSSVVCSLAAGIFYLLYTNVSGENKVLAEKAASLEKKYNTLVAEKEILMARLVISGKEPRVEPESKSRQTGDKDGSEKEPKQKIAEVLKKKKPEPEPVAPAEPEPDLKADVAENTEKSVVVSQEVDSTVKPEATGTVSEISSKDAEGSPEGNGIVNSVAVEKFSISRDESNKHLLVGFDIRNVSEKPGGVSGRIFAVLKPKNSSPENWLVVPTVPLKDGLPSIYRKGQYFSIAHFKPVRFRIENGKSPEEYKKAAIYIYNEEGELISETFITIEPNQTDPNG